MFLFIVTIIIIVISCEVRKIKIACRLEYEQNIKKINKNFTENIEN